MILHDTMKGKRKKKQTNWDMIAEVTQLFKEKKKGFLKKSSNLRYRRAESLVQGHPSLRFPNY